MKILSARFFALVAVLSVTAAIAIAATASASTPDAPTIGSTVADFKLPDTDGREHALSSLAGKNGIAIIFVSTNCPVSNGYNARMEKLAQDYKAKGVALVGINSNAPETPEEIKQHSTAQKFSFLVLKDKGNVIADRLAAQVTPEAYLLDAKMKLVYRGRIDNSRNLEGVTSSELRDAIEAMLAGKPIEKAEARAFGCSIKRVS